MHVNVMKMKRLGSAGDTTIIRDGDDYADGTETADDDCDLPLLQTDTAMLNGRCLIL